MRKKIFWYNTIIMVVSLIILSYVWNHISLKVNIEHAKKNTVRELSLINNSLNLLIETINDYTINVSVDYRLQRALEQYASGNVSAEDDYHVRHEIISAATGVMGLSDIIVGCNIVTANNLVFNISEILDNDIHQLIASEALPKTLPNIQWSDIFRMRHQNGDIKNIFVVQKQIIHVDSYEHLGVEYMFVDERDIAKIYLNNIKNDQSKFYILDHNNIILSSSEERTINQSFLTSQQLSTEDFQQLLRHNNGVITINNEASFASIQKVDSLDWMVVSTIPMKELTAQTRLFDTFILIIGLIYLIVGTMVASVASYTISKPIQRLVLTMRQIKSGNRDVRADTNTTKELQLLSNTFNSLMDKNEKLMVQLYEEQMAIRNYEFMLLQAQIKPHFLYNTLETISSFVKLNMYDEALQAVHCLANFCRISLNNGKDIITIGEELNLIESYLTIQRYRNIKYLDFDIHVDDVLFDKKIPKLTLQPIVENAIYHGMKPKRGKTELQIHGRLNKSDIIISVRDNGVGIPKKDLVKIRKQLEDTSRKECFGLHSVHSRIKLYYGDDYGITIDSIESEYTQINIKLPNERIEGAEE